MPPIKPAEVIATRQAAIPEEVFTAFNELITDLWEGNEARVLQDHVIDAILVKFKAMGKPIERQLIFDRGWLDIEAVYRKAGWKVVYDKTYNAIFTFSANR